MLAKTRRKLQAEYGWSYPGSVLHLDFVNKRHRFRNSVFPAVDILTCARASNKFAVNSNALIETFGNNVLSITDLGCLIERAATNNALWSRDMTQAAWTPTNVTVAQTATGIDGTANSATTLTSTAGNGTVLQSVTLGSAAYAYGVWLKRISGSGNIQITIDNGTTWATKTLTTSWRYFSVTKSAANPVIGIRIVTSGDSIAADYSQLEAGTGATSPILTTTGTASRNSDAVSFKVQGVLNPFEGSVLIDVFAPFGWNETSTVNPFTTYVTSANMLRLQLGSGVNFRFDSWSNNVEATAAGLFGFNVTGGSRYRCGASWGSGTQIIAGCAFGGGNFGTASQSFTPPISTPFTHFSLYGEEDTNWANLFVRQFIVTPTRLDLGALSTWCRSSSVSGGAGG